MNNGLSKVKKWLWIIVYTASSVTFLASNLVGMTYNITYRTVGNEKDNRRARVAYETHHSFIIIELLLSIVINFLLGRYVLEHKMMKFKGSSTEAKQSHEQSLTVTLVIVNVCQIIVLLPIAVLQFVFNSMMSAHLQVTYKQYFNIVIAAHWLYLFTYFNYGINAIIYMTRGQKYRVYIKKALRCGHTKKNPLLKSVCSRNTDVTSI